MKTLLKLGIAASALLSSLAYAGTAVLGFELGSSTVDQVQSKLESVAKVAAEGTNRYSRGPMLSTDGASYGIDGLNRVLYIFDDQGKLAGVIMTLGKHRFATIYEFVSAKYKARSENRPFVGDQQARFETSDAEIQLDAPHLSFQMEARYLRKDLLVAFRKQSAQEQKAKSTSEAAKF